MKTLYFDHNVIIDIQTKRKPAVAKSIDEINDDKYQVFFSPAHIEEIAALKFHHGKDEEKIHELLDFLARITSSKALLPFKRQDTVQVKKTGIYVSNEHPNTTYNRVVASYINNSIAENHQKEKIANGKIFEKETGITSKETNNIEINKEIDIFKPRLHQIILNNYQALSRMDRFLEYLPKRAPACHELNFQHLGEFFMMHEMTIEKMFEFLEVRRYFPDKSTQFLQGLYDTTHAIYAAYCDVFVTNDNKLKKKAVASYEWLGINTIILSPEELIDYLAE